MGETEAKTQLVRAWTAQLPTRQQLLAALKRLGSEELDDVAYLLCPRREPRSFIRRGSGWEFRGRYSHDADDAIASACALAAARQRHDDRYMDLARNRNSWLRVDADGAGKRLWGPVSLVPLTVWAEPDVAETTMIAALSATTRGAGVIGDSLYVHDDGISLYSPRSNRGAQGLAPQLRRYRFDVVTDGAVVSIADAQILIPVAMSGGRTTVGLHPDSVQAHIPQGAGVDQARALGIEILGGVNGEHALAVLIGGMIGKLPL